MICVELFMPLFGARPRVRKSQRDGVSYASIAWQTHKASRKSGLSQEPHCVPFISSLWLLACTPFFNRIIWFVVAAPIFPLINSRVNIWRCVFILIKNAVVAPPHEHTTHTRGCSKRHCINIVSSSILFVKSHAGPGPAGDN